MTKTFLFYDIETTGLNPCFDQILQFAAIRTDINLNELERHSFNIKLNCDVVPSPQASITHQIGITENENQLDEFSAITQIHQLLNTPGTMSIGYNSLGFDDEFLRFSFFRNLLPPYKHQFANQCSRADLYPCTIIFYLFKPSVLSIWPEMNGQTSLKLEYLSAANTLAQGQAHTAMVDVCATVALAKKFQLERETWNFLLTYFDKNSDLPRITQLDTCFQIGEKKFSQALLIEGKLGAKNNYIAPVLYLGPHVHYRNQNIWLRLDMENLAEQPYIIRRKLGENKFLLPCKENYLAKVASERQQLVKKNIIWLQQNPDFLQQLCAYHCNYTYPKVPNVDAQAALYENGFIKSEEESLWRQFHLAPLAKKMAIAHQFPNRVHQELALRIMGRHFFHILSDEQQLQFKEYLEKATQSDLANAPIDYQGQKKLTASCALAAIQELHNTYLTEKQQHLLSEIKVRCTQK